MSLNGIVEKALAGRWIAGENTDDALEAARRLNGKGVTAMINYLGEEFTNERDIDEAMNVYIDLMDAAEERKARISIAVKPTQLGLSIGRRAAERNYSELVKTARGQKIFVWLDMETHECVSDTIEMYLKEAGKGGVGICIQSYLKRSEKDVKRLVRHGAVIRLVKGAYSEGGRMAYRNRAETTKNYERLMEYLFGNARSFMVATHDESLIERALELKKESGARISFAMLNGIRNEYAFELAKKKEDVSIYVPFGGRWVSYGYRRLKELENSKLILRSLLGPQS